MAATSLMDASAATPKVLVSQQLAATETTQYTAAALNWVKVVTAILTNTSGSAVNISLSVCKTGQTADGTHRVMSNYPLAAGDSIVVSELAQMFLGPGDFISAIAGTAAAVTLVASGLVFW